MRSRTWGWVAGSALALLIAAGLVFAGRLTVDRGPSRGDGYRAGQSAGYSTGYAAGLQEGAVQGRLEGRVSQVGDSLPADAQGAVRDAFKGGYAAGANDAFAGYDGGWGLSEPYVITLERATTPIVYRISSRTEVLSGVNYFLCASGRGLCQEARR